jgi:hypothetical protein
MEKEYNNSKHCKTFKTILKEEVKKQADPFTKIGL